MAFQTFRPETAPRNGNRIRRTRSRVRSTLSVEEVGVYKPHPSVYQLAVDRLGFEREAISFQSSNSWDAYSASAFGMRVVWCNRHGQRPECLPGKPDREVRSLADLPALLSVE